MKVVKTIKEVSLKVFALKNNVLKLADPVIQISCVNSKGEKEYVNLGRNTGRCLEGFKNDGRLTLQNTGDNLLQRSQSLDILQSHIDTARKFGNCKLELTLFDAKNWNEDEPQSAEQPDDEGNPLE